MTWLISAVGFALLRVWVFYREEKLPEPLMVVDGFPRIPSWHYLIWVHMVH